MRKLQVKSRSGQPDAHLAHRAAPVTPGFCAPPEESPGGTHRQGRDEDRTWHLRGTPVAVLVGDGLDAAAPRYRDVAVEKAEVNANHRHPAAELSGCWCRKLLGGGRVLCWAVAPGVATPTRSKGEVTRSRYALNRGQRVGQPRRGRGRRTAASAAGVSPLRVGVSNRQLPSSEPARSASRETREPLLRPLPSALGQRPLVELRVRERSGKWRRLSQPAGGWDWEGGAGGSGRRQETAVARSPSRGGREHCGWLGERRPRPAASEAALGCGWPPGLGTAAGCHRDGLPGFQGPTAAQHPPAASPSRGAHVPPAALGSVRSRPLCSAAASPKGAADRGKAAFSLQCLCESRLNR